MARSVNQITIIGHLGKDSETRFTPAGKAKSTFSVATSRSWKDKETGDWKEETDWHNVAVWESESLANMLTKGKRVYVQGRIQYRSYEGKDGLKKYFTEIVADAHNVLLLDGAPQREPEAFPDQKGTGKMPPYREMSLAPQPLASQPRSAVPYEPSDDDVPF